MVATPTRMSAHQLSEAARKAPASTVDAATRLLRSVTLHSERTEFVNHVLATLADITPPLSELPAPTSGFDALMQLLEQPEALADLRTRDPLAPARIRGMRMKEQLLEAAGGAVSSAEFANLAGITRQAVDKRRRAGQVIALDLGKRGYVYPRCQAGIAGLSRVLPELGEFDAWTQLAYLLSPNVWLDGETPLVLLERGEIGRVVEAANHYGEQIGA